MDDHAGIVDTFTTYLSAYTAGDLDTVVDYYDLPYALIEPSGSTVLSTVDALRARFATMRDGTQASGHQSGEWKDLRVQPLGPSLASVAARLVWKGADGQQRAAVDLVYLMRRRSERWKIVAVVPYGG